MRTAGIAVLIALVSGGVIWGLIVVAVYYGIQWSENNIVVPIVFKHAVNLSSVGIMFAMLVGISFPSIVHPILGILLSIPVASIVSIFLDDLRKTPEGK